jgi:hypothetical protein
MSQGMQELIFTAFGMVDAMNDIVMIFGCVLIAIPVIVWRMVL